MYTKLKSGCWHADPGNWNRFLYVFLSLAFALSPVREVFCLEPGGSSFRLDTALNSNGKHEISGAWGTLEVHQLILEPPEFYLSLSSDLRNWKNGTVWRFEATSEEGVEGILKGAGVSRQYRDQLLSPQYLSYDSEKKQFEIRPPEHVLLGLTSETRRILYPQIHPQVRQNPYTHPYALPVGGLQKVLSLPTGVPEEQLRRVEKLSYKIGNTTRFSDINLVLAKSQSEHERRRILKTLARERSLSVTLRITGHNDLPRLAQYWSAGGKNKEMLPILESVLMAPGIETLDLIHLLPPTPRKLLHTYPSSEGYGIGDELPDCHWTAASFFSEDPPDRYLDTVGQVILNRYEAATKPLQLGDMILLDDKATGRPIHTCNYIAGNLVYTKNGKSPGRPWIISTLDDVIEEYLLVEAINITFLRLKPEYLK